MKNYLNLTSLSLPFYSTQMENNLNNYLKELRTNYNIDSLDISTVSPNPISQFESWMSFALGQKVHEPNAMNLATVNHKGRPSSRIVLLRGVSMHGFTFYTNYESKKGKDLSKNNFAALNFFWPQLEKQIRIEGKIEKVPAQISDDYFKSRPLESRIGAIASKQSSEIPSRDFLEQTISELNEKFKSEVPRPENWGGYILRPDYFEFWQGRSNRLHDRICYSLNNKEWKISRLSP